MKNFKKLISLILCFTLVFSTFMFVVNADEDVADDETEVTASYGDSDEDYPIIFVTGIGQSYSYLYASEEDAQADIAENATDRATNRWNLFCNDFSFAFKEIGTYPALLTVLFSFIASAIFDTNLIPKSAVDKVVSTLFRYNTVDSEGKLPSVVVTPRCNYPVSQYTTEQRENFYRTIPCEDVIGDIGEDMLYCFNYSAFSCTFNNSDDLDTFINDYVLPQTGKDKVILIPMSMGASVVSAYLYDYGTKAQVARVVSIVGAWYGSDVFADLIELKYADDAPEKLYNGIVADLIGAPYGYLVNVVLRIFPKATLRSIIDELLDSVVRNLVLKTPSLMALVPPDRYQQIRKDRLEGNSSLAYVLEQTDRYYECQTHLEETVKNLSDNYGVDFYYLAGYGLKFGGYSSDYKFFQFLETAETTNSDEIIQISSTVPGSTYVKAGTEFDSAYLSSHDSEFITPDKSVDISGSFFPTHVWLFSGQKHELENNNTALKIALSCATGDLTGTDTDSTYPRFNDSRDLKRLKRSYIPDLETWLETNTPTSSQQALIDENMAAVEEMMANTVNNRVEDDKVIENFRQMLVALGIYEDSSSSNDDGGFLKSLNDNVYKVFGAAGFADIFKIF